MTQDDSIRAVLFDAAGTLIHLREPLGVTYARLLRSFGVQADPARLDDAFRQSLATMPPMVFAGEAASIIRGRERAWWEDLVRCTLRAAGTTEAFVGFDRYFALLFSHFAGAAAWRLEPNVHDVLVALRGRGVRTAVVSNFDSRLNTILGVFGVLPLIDFIALPSNTGFAKPDPRIFHAALARLSVHPSRALHLGDDAEADVAAARAAGLRALNRAELGDLSELLDLV